MASRDNSISTPSAVTDELSAFESSDTVLRGSNSVSERDAVMSLVPNCLYIASSSGLGAQTTRPCLMRAARY